MVRSIFALYPDMDIRDVLPTIHVPTLVVHRLDVFPFCLRWKIRGTP